MVAWCSRWLLLVAALLGFLQVSSTFEVKEGNETCIIANFSMHFKVEYDTKTKKESAYFLLPSDAKVLPESTCGKKNKTSQVLAVGFGKGHSLRMMFDSDSGIYKVNKLIFSYNLSDSTLFPNSTGPEKMKNATSETDIQAGLNTKYTCHNNNTLNMTDVIVLLSNVTLEAYLTNNTFSKNETVCFEDRVSTTVPPKTTSIPSTTSLAPPTPTKTPDVRQYNLTGENGTCLLASMGLQLNVTYKTKTETKKLVLNLPSNATYNGTCETNSITLNLISGSTALIFQFAQNKTLDKYFLHGITLSTNLPSEATEKSIKVANSNLSALKATLGRSYKCNAEESIWLSNNASVNIFSVQVQAFRMSGDKFGAVEECQQDENNMLIPIVVGAALAGLVLIVLIAYLIGRKRSHAGYQTI